MAEKYFLGIDTSNYTTSIALVDETKKILFEKKIILQVKEGKRGLKQSDAFFQHIQNLPILMQSLFSEFPAGQIVAVGASARPRPIEESYMPVFTAGTSFAKTIAMALNIDYYETSHQENHIEAGIFNESHLKSNQFLVFHLSGGTAELLRVVRKKTAYEIEKIGGSLDITFGQLIDRIGVKLGCQFPCGKELDDIAMKNQKADIDFKLKEIHVAETYLNLSGIETECFRIIETLPNLNRAAFIGALFYKMSKAIYKSSIQASKITGIRDIVFVGGVASSAKIKEDLIKMFSEHSLQIYFSDAKYASDHAIGTAFLTSKKHLKDDLYEN